MAHGSADSREPSAVADVGQPSAEPRAVSRPQKEQKKRGPRKRGPLFFAYFCGLPGGFSPLKTSRLIWMYSFMFAGTSSSGKMAVTGHSGSHAPQSIHSSGWMYSWSGPSYMQSTGQTSTQARS